MPLEYLREIVARQLPLEVIDQSKVDRIRVLAAAGMIVADLPESGKTGPAVVHSITGYGRALLTSTRHAAVKSEPPTE